MSSTYGLFIGRLAHDTRSSDLNDLFAKYGTITRCEVKKGFGFVDFSSKDEAAEALRALDGKTLLGQAIAVDWAKEKRGGDRPSGDGCYNCGRPGHFARECTERGGRGGRDSGRRGRSRSRSRSRSRGRGGRRSRSRSPPRRRSRSRSRSPVRRRSRSRSPRRRSRSRSRSPRRRSRSRSRSPKRVRRSTSRGRSASRS